MRTECKSAKYIFQALGGRSVEGLFDGGAITSDAGGLLLREVEKRWGVIHRFAGCFQDLRDERFVEHGVEEMVRQRIYGLALGYEDLNDHDDLRRDPLMGVLVGKRDPEGGDRIWERDQGRSCAGKSTLNRLELSANGTDHYKKTPLDFEAAQRSFVEQFIAVHRKAPRELVIDMDATDDPLHGEQEGRFFHGFYDCYCYLPLYAFCEGYVLSALLRESNIDASLGAEEELERIVGLLRQAWPRVRLLVRCDSGFCREPLMAWCEANQVDYLFGIAKNERLKQELEPAMEQARAKYESTGSGARVFADFSYRTLKSWSRSRRVVGRADWTDKGANPRFVVTSLPPKKVPARKLYERLYCARCDAENRIKEQQLELFADRTSTSRMRSNQLRLWFSSLAYNLLHLLRQTALQGTELARAQCGTIRNKLLKIGAQIRISVRRIAVHFTEACPYQTVFAQALAHMQGPAG